MQNTHCHAWHKGGDSMPLFPCHSSLSQPQGRTVLVVLQDHLLLFLDGAVKQQIAACCPVLTVLRSACSAATIGSVAYVNVS